MIKRFYILFVLCLFTTFATAQTITSKASGEWTLAVSWDGGVPTETSDVVIKENSEITINEEVTANSLEIANGILVINQGGKLIVSTFSGSSTLKLFGNNYPTVTTDNFSGKTVLSGDSYTFNQTKVNSLEINLSESSNTLTLADNIIINGNLTITKGKTNITGNVVVNGDIEIAEGAELTGNGSISVAGNVDNKGTISGSSLSFNFIGENSETQNVTLDGISKFGNITIDRKDVNREVLFVADNADNFSSTKITITSGSFVAGSNIYLDDFSIGTAIADNAGLIVSNGKISLKEDIAVVKGKLTVVNGTFTAKKITLQGGEFTINGGSSEVTNLECTSGSGKFNQNGGTLNIENIKLTSSDATYTATNGTVYVERDLSLKCNENVTGGTIVKDINDGNFEVSVPLWDLVVNKKINVNGNSDIKILNNLTINDNGELNSVNKNVVLNGNLTIAENGNLSCSKFYFNGDKNSNVEINNSSFNFSEIVVNKNNFDVNFNDNITVDSSLTVNSGTINAKDITAKGDIINNGTIIGNVILSNEGIKFSGSGNYDVITQNVNFANLNSKLTTNQYIFKKGKCNLNTYVITINNVDGISGASENSYFVNNGDKASAGLNLKIPKKDFSEGETLQTWYIGTDSYYAPAFVTAKESGTSTEEFVTINAIGKQHPCLKTDNGENLPCYWKVSASGVNDCKLTLQFQYKEEISKAFTSLALLNNSEWVEAKDLYEYSGIVYFLQPKCNIISSVSGYLYNSSSYKTLKSVYPCGSVDGIELYSRSRTTNSKYLLGTYYEEPDYGSTPKYVTTYGINSKTISFNNCTDSPKLISGDYTAGVKDNSTGMRILYTSLNGEISTRISANSSNWVLGDGTANQTPKAGDILVINGCDWCTFGSSSSVDNIGKIIFQRSEDENADLGRCVFQNKSGLSIGEFSGVGIIQIENDFSSQFSLNTDYSQFDINDESSYIIYFNGSDKTKEISISHEGDFPNMTIGTASTNRDRTLYYSTDLSVRRNLNIRRTTFEPRHNVYCGGLLLGGVYEGILKFNPSYETEFYVNGDVNFDFILNSVISENKVSTEGTGDRYVSIANNTGNKNNRLVINGNIIAETGYSNFKEQKMGFDLINNNGKFVTLEFAGENNDSVRVTPRDNFLFNIKQMVINKEPGSYIKLSDVKVNFDNSLAANASDNKTLVMQQGEVIFDVDGQEVPLTTGGEDFYVPENAVVTANKGVTLSATGCSSGIELAGTLNANSKSVWDIQGHIYYKGEKAVVNQRDAEFKIATQLCPTPNTSGSLELNILTDGAELFVGTNSCSDVDKSTAGIFALSEGSHLTMEKNSKIVVGKSFNETSLADIYMQMPSESVKYGSGAVFQIGNDNNIDATINSITPIPNAVIFNSSKLSCLTNDLTVLGNLTVNKDATLNQNARQINLYGDFNLINGGTFAHNSTENDIFNFSGANQNIYGNPEFYIAKLNESAKVTVNDNITVDNLLSIGENNTLISEDSDIKVLGTYSNSGVYLYNGTGAGKGIYLNGTSAQEIISSGVNGKITLDNSAGAFVKTTTNPLIINKNLTLLSGILSIDDNVLQLNRDAEISGDNFGVDKMIKFTKSYLTNGVTKIFDGNSKSFTFPFGTDGKYTPATLNITSIDDNAKLTLCPHDELYIAITDDKDEDPDFDDTKNALQYYWTIKSDGVSSLIGDVVFTHVDGDALADNSSGYTVNDNYICAKLLDREVEWNKYVDFSTGNVYNAENHILKFKFDSFADAQLSGAYTAGVCQSKDGVLDAKGIGAIPDRISSYVTVDDGEWHDEKTWVLCDPVTQEPKTDIDGNQIHEIPLDGASTFIRHKVEIKSGEPSDYKKISNLRTIIDGEDGNVLMDINKHYFGNVSGIGRITFTNNCTFAAGSYIDFVSAGGGTFSFTGDKDYPVFGEFNIFNNVEFLGSGIRTANNLDNIIFNGNITIGDNAVVDCNDKNWNVAGDFIFDGGEFLPQNSTITFNGSVKQQIKGESPNALTLNNLELDNIKGLSINVPVDIKEKLIFKSGIVYTFAEKPLRLTNSSQNLSDVTENFGEGRYVDGPISKLIINDGGFEFPIGSDMRVGILKLASTSVTNNAYWTAQYFNSHPEPRNAENFSDGIKRLSDNEYWKLKCDQDGGQAVVYIRWDARSGAPADAESRQNMRMAQNKELTESSLWGIVGGTNSSDIIDNGDNAGTISSSEKLSHENTFYAYTFADVHNYRYIWTGAENTDWFNKNNWEKRDGEIEDVASIPSSDGEVEIQKPSNENLPIIDDASKLAQAKTLKILGDATVTVNAGSKLTVYDNTIFAQDGNVVNGAYKPGNGYIILNSSNNLENKMLTGSLITYGDIINGENRFIVSRNFRKKCWERFSLPMNGVSSSTFSRSQQGRYNGNFYYYDETADLDNDATTAPDINKERESMNKLAEAWEPVEKSGAVKLNSKKGYLYADIYGKKISFTGKVNSGKIDLDGLTFTPNDLVEDSETEKGRWDGWNFVGNPYPSALDWDAIQPNLENIDGTVYIYDNAGNYYSNYSNGITVGVKVNDEFGELASETSGSSRFIPAMQGFFVHTQPSAANKPATISLTADMLTHAGADIKYKGKYVEEKDRRNIVKLKTVNDNTADVLAIYFSNDATSGFDAKTDAYKFEAGNDKVVDFYSLNNGNSMSINSLPDNEIDGTVVKLGYNAKQSGDYSIDVDLLNFNENYVYLVDKSTGEEINLDNQKSYKFSTNSGVFNDRFELRFNVNHAPRKIQSIDNQRFVCDKEFYLPIGDVFEEIDNGDEIVSFNVTLADGSALPSWIKYDYAQKAFVGTPENAGNITISMSAEDKKNAISKIFFNIETYNQVVENQIVDNKIEEEKENIINNNAPVNVVAIDDVVFNTGKISYQLPQNAFFDPDGDVLRYAYYMADGSELPSWLKFNSSTGLLVGKNYDSQTLDLKVVATDPEGLYADAYFSLTIDIEQEISVEPISSVSKFDFNAYPNPSSGIVNIDAKNIMDFSNDYRIIVTNASGGIVINKRYDSSLIHLDLTNCSKGTYLVTIVAGNIKQTKKIIIY